MGKGFDVVEDFGGGLVAVGGVGSSFEAVSFDPQRREGVVVLCCAVDCVVVVLIAALCFGFFSGRQLVDGRVVKEYGTLAPFFHEGFVVSFFFG